MPKLVGIREAARELGVAYDLVYRLVKSGDLPSVVFSVSKRIYIDRTDLDRLIERNKEVATP